MISISRQKLLRGLVRVYKTLSRYKSQMIFFTAICVILHAVMKREHIQTKEDQWLLVLCTTFFPSYGRHIVHNNTMKNWKSLGADILPVLFIEEKYTDVRETFILHGWHVLPIKGAFVDNCPAIRNLFRELRMLYKTKYIGYANADILFNEDLLKTINLVEKHRKYFIFENEIFITGSRFDVRNVSFKDFSSSEKIKHIKMHQSTKHPPNGQDYFITDFDYPWDMIPGIIVGKHRVDNWLLINAIENYHSAIDASESITALHQSIDSGSWEAVKLISNFSNYNENLLTSIYGAVHFYAGSLDCLPLVFNHTLSDEIVLLKREHFPYYCKRQLETTEILKRKLEEERQQKFIEIERKNKKKQPNIHLNVTLKSSVKRNVIRGKNMRLHFKQR